MRIVVIGAGVIGSVYAARLAEADNDVTLVARGRLAVLRDAGLRVRGDRESAPAVELLQAGGPLPPADLVIVTVRATQLDAVLDTVTALDATTVLLQHLGPGSGHVLERLCADRTVFAFPGVGGLIRGDGTVEYVEIAAQPTTIDAAAPRAQQVRDVIARTRMRTALEPDMAGWYATHEVFVACMGAGILNCGGDAASLSHDRVELRRVVSAVHEGFGALASQGVGVTPTALRVLFSRMPRRFAAWYWRRALRGPVGTVALAPHTRASRYDEFRLLCRSVLERVGPGRAASLAALLRPYA